MHHFENVFSRLPSKHLDEQLLPLKVVDRNNFVAEFYHLKVKNPIFAYFLSFRLPNEGKE